MYQFFYHTTMNNWRAVLLLVGIAIMIDIYVILKSKGNPYFKWGKHLVFLGYLYIMFSVTLGSRGVWDAKDAELYLFWTYYEVITLHKTHYLMENLSNVLMFLPLGMYLQSLDIMKGKVSKVIGIGFCFSLCIECMQWFYGRGCFDVDDLFHNTLGTVIGFIVMKKVEAGFSDSRQKGA